MMPGGHQVRWEDSSLAVGAASILLPSAAEGSCPVELGNPPILALTLMRHKGCTVLRIRFLLHQCGALKSLFCFAAWRPSMFTVFEVNPLPFWALAAVCSHSAR